MGLRRTEQLLFFFPLFLGEKQFTHSSSLYFCDLHRANIAVRVAFDHHRAFQRRKTSRFVVERTLPTPRMWRKQSVSCPDETYFSVLLPAHSGDPTCRQTLNHNLLVEEPELNLLVFAIMQH